MTREDQSRDGAREDGLLHGEMWRTTGKNGMATGSALVVNVDNSELRRLRRIAETMHGDVAGLTHSSGIGFAVSRVDTGTTRYTFVLPLVGQEVLRMLEMLHLTGFRVAFQGGNEDVVRYAMPVTPECASEFQNSHLLLYSKQVVLRAVSSVAVNFLEEPVDRLTRFEHLVCVVATPELKAWAACTYGSA